MPAMLFSGETQTKDSFGNPEEWLCFLFTCISNWEQECSCFTSNNLFPAYSSCSSSVFFCSLQRALTQASFLHSGHPSPERPLPQAVTLPPLPPSHHSHHSNKPIGRSAFPLPSLPSEVHFQCITRDAKGGGGLLVIIGFFVHQHTRH